MNNNLKSISIKLLSKEYRINCPHGQEAELVDAALLLDQKMLEIRGKGRIYGIERIAIMAALNLAHELLQQNNTRDSNANEINQRLQQLNARIEKALEVKDKQPAEAELAE